MRIFGILVATVLSMACGYLMAETISERVTPEDFWQSQENTSEMQVASVSTTDAVGYMDDLPDDRGTPVCVTYGGSRRCY